MTTPAALVAYTESSNKTGGDAIPEWLARVVPILRAKRSGLFGEEQNADQFERFQPQRPDTGPAHL